jgi:hypothetical protein
MSLLRLLLLALQQQGVHGVHGCHLLGPQQMTPGLRVLVEMLSACSPGLSRWAVHCAAVQRTHTVVCGGAQGAAGMGKQAGRQAGVCTRVHEINTIGCFERVLHAGRQAFTAGLYTHTLLRHAAFHRFFTVFSVRPDSRRVMRAQCEPSMECHMHSVISSSASHMPFFASGLCGGGTAAAAVVVAEAEMVAHIVTTPPPH